MDVRMTLLANKLYLPSVLVAVSLFFKSSKAEWAYESVRKPEAATPQMRKFHEFRSSS